MEHGGFGEVYFPKGEVFCQRQAKLCALPLLSIGVEAAAQQRSRLLPCLLFTVTRADAWSSCIMNVFLFISPHPPHLAL